jgi:hypothetical protein
LPQPLTNWSAFGLAFFIGAVMVDQLNPAEQHILKYLRQQVDRLQDERYRTDARPSIMNEIYAAQQELKRYVLELRKKGYNI